MNREAAMSSGLQICPQYLVRTITAFVKVCGRLPEMRVATFKRPTSENAN